MRRMSLLDYYEVIYERAVVSGTFQRKRKLIDRYFQDIESEERYSSFVGKKLGNAVLNKALSDEYNYLNNKPVVLDHFDYLSQSTKKRMSRIGIPQVEIMKVLKSYPQTAIQVNQTQAVANFNDIHREPKTMDEVDDEIKHLSTLIRLLEDGNKKEVVV